MKNLAPKTDAGFAKLGFLANRLDLNDMAAKGVSLSLKDTLGLKVKEAVARELVSDEDSGLEFVTTQKKPTSPEEDKPKMLQVNGQMVAQERTGPNNARSDFLKQLRTKTIEKKQGFIGLDQLKSTFNTTELQSKAKAIPEEQDDPLVEDEADDSEFEIEQPEPPMKWDEDEQIRSKDPSLSVAAKSSSAQPEEEAEESVEASMDASLDASDIITRRKHKDTRKALRKKAQEAERAKMRKFMDIEADLGSDNEENDRVKEINREDAEEQEEGMDADL